MVQAQAPHDLVKGPVARVLPVRLRHQVPRAPVVGLTSYGVEYVREEPRTEVEPAGLDNWTIRKRTLTYRMEVAFSVWTRPAARKAPKPL